MDARGSVSSGAEFTLPVLSLAEVSIFRAKMLFLERSCCWQSGTQRAGSGLRIGQGPTLAQRGSLAAMCLWERKRRKKGKRRKHGAGGYAEVLMFRHLWRTLWQAPDFSQREQIKPFEAVLYGSWNFMHFSNRLHVAACSLICLLFHRSWIWKSCVMSSK